MGAPPRPVCSSSPEPAANGVFGQRLPQSIGILAVEVGFRVLGF